MAHPYRSGFDCFLTDTGCLHSIVRNLLHGDVPAMSLVRLQQVSITQSSVELGAVMDLSRRRVFFSKDRLAFSPSRQS